MLSRRNTIPAPPPMAAGLRLADRTRRGIWWVTGTYLLPEIIADFQHSHPAVRITLELGTAAEAVEWLRLHRAELGVIAGSTS